MNMQQQNSKRREFRCDTQDTSKNDNNNITHSTNNNNSYFNNNNITNDEDDVSLSSSEDSLLLHNTTSENMSNMLHEALGDQDALYQYLLQDDSGDGDDDNTSEQSLLFDPNENESTNDKEHEHKHQHEPKNVQDWEAVPCQQLLSSVSSPSPSPSNTAPTDVSPFSFSSSRKYAHRETCRDTIHGSGSDFTSASRSVEHLENALELGSQTTSTLARQCPHQQLEFHHQQKEQDCASLVEHLEGLLKRQQEDAKEVVAELVLKLEHTEQGRQYACEEAKDNQINLKDMLRINALLTDTVETYKRELAEPHATTPVTTESIAIQTNTTCIVIDEVQQEEQEERIRNMQSMREQLEQQVAVKDNELVLERSKHNAWEVDIQQELKTAHKQNNNWKTQNEQLQDSLANSKLQQEQDQNAWRIEKLAMQDKINAMALQIELLRKSELQTRLEALMCREELCDNDDHSNSNNYDNVSLENETTAESRPFDEPKAPIIMDKKGENDLLGMVIENSQICQSSLSSDCMCSCLTEIEPNCDITDTTSSYQERNRSEMITSSLSLVDPSSSVGVAAVSVAASVNHGGVDDDEQHPNMLLKNISALCVFINEPSAKPCYTTIPSTGSTDGPSSKIAVDQSSANDTQQNNSNNTETTQTDIPMENNNSNDNASLCPHDDDIVNETCSVHTFNKAFGSRKEPNLLCPLNEDNHRSPTRSDNGIAFTNSGGTENSVNHDPDDMKDINGSVDGPMEYTNEQTMENTDRNNVDGIYHSVGHASKENTVYCEDVLSAGMEHSSGESAKQADIGECSTHSVVTSGSPQEVCENVELIRESQVEGSDTKCLIHSNSTSWNQLNTIPMEASIDAACESEDIRQTVHFSSSGVLVPNERMNMSVQSTSSSTTGEFFQTAAQVNISVGPSAISPDGIRKVPVISSLDRFDATSNGKVGVKPLLTGLGTLSPAQHSTKVTSHISEVPQQPMEQTLENNCVPVMVVTPEPKHAVQLQSPEEFENSIDEVMQISNEDFSDRSYVTSRNSVKQPEYLSRSESSDEYPAEGPNLLLEQCRILAESLTGLVDSEKGDEHAAGVWDKLENLANLLEMPDSNAGDFYQDSREDILSFEKYDPAGTHISEMEQDMLMMTDSKLVMFEESPIKHISDTNKMDVANLFALQPFLASLTYEEEAEVMNSMTSPIIRNIFDKLYGRCQLLESERSELLSETLNMMDSSKESNNAELEAAVATALKQVPLDGL